MKWNRSRIDPFVVELDQRFGEHRMPSDPVARREQMRGVDAAAAQVLGIVVPPVFTEDRTITVDGHPDARLRVFWPGEQRGGKDLPILVYFFGGSFTMGDLDWAGWDAVFRSRAADAGVIVVAGEYSLAPEVQYPAQPEQCWSVFEWAVAHAAELGGDASRIAVGGALAGGNLAAAVALMNRDRHHRPVRLQMLEAPVLDLTLRHIHPRAISAVLPLFALQRAADPIVRDYLGRRRATRHEPYASPLLAPDHSGLPPAVIYTAEMDPLRGDGEAYGRALSASGVPATGVRYLGQTHGSGGYRRLNPAADHLHRDIVATLRTLHGPEVAYGDNR